jgi:hypothetical protein
MDHCARKKSGTLTFAAANFFSVPMMAPLRAAALRALFPLIVVSRVAVPGPRTLLPILVTDSQSSDILFVCWIVNLIG